MDCQNYCIQTIKKIVGLENILSEIDFKVITWNRDINTLFHLKYFEQGIDTLPPDSFPVSYKRKTAGAVAQGVYYSLGQQCLASAKRAHGIAG